MGENIKKKNNTGRRCLNINDALDIETNNRAEQDIRMVQVT